MHITGPFERLPTRPDSEVIVICTFMLIILNINININNLLCHAIRVIYKSHRLVSMRTFPYLVNVASLSVG